MHKEWQIPDDFGLRSPVVQKTFSLERGIPKYNLPRSWVKESPSFRKCFRQKEVYLNTIYDDFGLRTPVIRKKFQTKSSTSIVARVIFHVGID